MRNNLWPALRLEEWKETYATLHMWTQVVGKIRLAQTPLINHWWNVPLYVTARGLTTSAMSYKDRTFQIDFDFIDHQLLIKCDDGASATIALAPCSVADFYREVMRVLHGLGLEVKIWPVPVEVQDPIPFEQDHKHASYDAGSANRVWRILVQADKVFTEFRSHFIGKCSPVHFFWGSFDLAVTRFSGRRAPERVGADKITREGYSHEVISAGFWPGSGNIQDAAFYAYAAPEPLEYNTSPVQPPAAFYNPPTNGFILMYDDVRKANNPDRMVLDFLRSTYEAGAELGKWDRRSLEREAGL
jgi:hypothetical protein